ncbi:hypothetical protein [Chryseobacterium sp.]|uniref:hypothetical protein n=1 Tax=Chryseobacterium sp. TaxID=1871047 RepID=UPI00289E985E|nr:hypothetical protein [Chryseobacterium sp.]
MALKDYEKIIVPKYSVININTTEDFEIDNWKNWNQIFLLIDSLIKLFGFENETFIRTFQSFEFENNWLGFGRMKWNEQNNQKWTTKYKIEEFSDKKSQFFNTEIWSPDWNHYEKTGETPKIFINVYKESDSNTGLIIAIKKAHYKQNELLLDSLFDKIKKVVPNSNLRKIERYWKASLGFQNAIQDMNYNELDRILKSCSR